MTTSYYKIYPGGSSSTPPNGQAYHISTEHLYPRPDGQDKPTTLQSVDDYQENSAKVLKNNRWSQLSMALGAVIFLGTGLVMYIYLLPVIMGSGATKRTLAACLGCARTVNSSVPMDANDTMTGGGL